jgi:uncharacterized protein (TIGR00661 family)
LKKKIKNIAIFVSDEGFGHSVRQKIIILELLRTFKNCNITIFNRKRLNFFKEYFGTRINYQYYPDILYTKKNKNGELSIKETRKVLQKWPAKSYLAIQKIKKNFNFDIVISDLVPEAFRLSKHLGIPSFGVARFTWDWFFFNINFKNLKAINLISEDLKFARKIYFPIFFKKKILSNHYLRVKLTNLIFNYKTFKEETHQIAVSNNRYKCLIMDNGNKTNSYLIMDSLKYLSKIKHIDFYIGIDNFPDDLNSYIAETKNIIPVTGTKNMHHLISYVDFLIARGGHNTITEILYFQKPALLIDEKNNPEVKENIFQMKKLKLAALMSQKSFKNNFNKRIIFFIENELDLLKKNLMKNSTKFNGAKLIVKDILKSI